MGTIVLVLAVLATACGGGGRLSAREYVQEASRICRQASHRAGRTDRATKQAAIQDAAASDLADLKPPESLTGFDAAWVALVRQSASELDALVVAVHAGDTELVAHQRENVAALTARAAEMARARGITACPAHFVVVDATPRATSPPATSPPVTSPPVGSQA